MNPPRLAVGLALALGAPAVSHAVTIFGGLSFTPALAAPLAGTLSVATDVPSRVSVVVDDGLETWARDFFDYATNHSVPLYGFKPGLTNSITVTVWDRYRNGFMAPTPLPFVTAPLPADFPTLNVLVSQPDRMEPGYTLLTVQNATAVFTYLTLLDNTGAVVWYSSQDQVPTALDVRQLADGNLLIPLTDEFVELSLLGEIVNTWTPPDNLSIDLHDGVPTDENSILFINDYSQVVSNFPTSATFPGALTAPTTVAANSVIEMSLTNSALLNGWSLLDLLDPVRVSYLTFTVPDDLGVDWGHANSVIDDPSDNTIIASLRHQNAVVKFTRQGQLVWILGPPANWGPQWQPYLLTPVGAPFEWNYGQHAATLTPQGTVLMYDDGNYRASPFDPPVPDSANYSRAVEFAVNPQTMRVSQVWQYGQDVPEPLFTAALGIAQWLTNTGNVLVHFGLVSYVDHAVPSAIAPEATMIRIQEVTHQQTPEVLFDLAIWDYGNSDPDYRGYWSYRSRRVPDLYAHPAVPVADLTVSYSGGVPLLQFSADPVRTYLLEASSDLKNWSVLGAAQTEAGGLYDFYDVSGFLSGTNSARYYRVQTQ